MIIKSIELTNFRSHAAYRRDFNPDTTMILGQNGCGKTSVLEAIYILTRGKSFRADDREILKIGAPHYRISLEYDNGQKTAAVFDGHEKTFLVANQKFHRLPDKSKYPVVLFEPQDLNLITNSPGSRRDYFDRFFAQLADDYAETFNNYKKTLDQRNKFLKLPNCSPSGLFTWNLLLARYGTKLKNYRSRLVDEVNKTLNMVYYSIAENADRIRIHHKTEVTTEEDFIKTLEENYEKDHILTHTTFGPQRDDFVFIFNHKNASGSASRGESRSIILALKFVEANLLERKLREKPLVLLDDVFSELDQSRRQALVQNFKDHQVIITSVEDVNEQP